MSDFIYDEESYPNIYTLSARAVGSVLPPEQPVRHRFEISHRRDDRERLLAWVRWLASTGCRMVGFNNMVYDYPLLHFILTQQPSVEQIYQKTLQIIDGDFNRRFDHIIWDRDQIVPQIDLLKIHHFDNKAKMTSLKALEFAMRSPNVQDLPFPPGTILTDAQMDELIIYNDHDVDETMAFYEHTLPMIRFREELSVKFGKNFINHNNGKIGSDYLIDKLEKAIPGACYGTDGAGKRVMKQTWRSQIVLKDVMFPWIRFKRPEFIAVQEWFAAQVITETKGVFNDIPLERLGSLAQYCTLKTNRNTKKVTAENLNCVVNGFQFDFGTGGLHGSVASQTVASDDEYELKDVDVTSFYPSLGIVNKVYPLHLGPDFPLIYGEIKEERLTHPKGTPENAALKEALNVAYGKSNSVYSPFMDSYYTMAITINGQLLLCLLADYLMDIPGLKLIQVNTDGITFRYPRSQSANLKVVTEWWQAHTCLDLEDAVYSRMFIRDVNSYIAEYEGGKLKRKGAYEWKSVEFGGTLGWHQNHSELIVAKAAEACLVEGIPVRDFILNHDDIFDFMILAKVPRNSRLLIRKDGVDTPCQNVCRYYVSKTGGALVKVMPPLPKKPDKWREIGIAVGWKVRECNDISRAVGQDIDMEYYIQEAEKLVNPVRRVL